MPVRVVCVGGDATAFGKGSNQLREQKGRQCEGGRKEKKIVVIMHSS